MQEGNREAVLDLGAWTDRIRGADSRAVASLIGQMYADSQARRAEVSDALASYETTAQNQMRTLSQAKVEHLAKAEDLDRLASYAEVTATQLSTEIGEVYGETYLADVQAEIVAQREAQEAYHGFTQAAEAIAGGEQAEAERARLVDWANEAHGTLEGWEAMEDDDMLEFIASAADALRLSGIDSGQVLRTAKSRREQAGGNFYTFLALLFQSSTISTDGR